MTCKVPNRLFNDYTSIIRRYQYLKLFPKPNKTQKRQIKAIEDWNSKKLLPLPLDSYDGYRL